ncbi:unnamed protein product [Medioppia subpectinata]|uniref:Peptidase S1 domain-containing protein n=1 Tax=Medioppia subpectinata TaxID=1979941 RepID=A0A7R9KPM9_9ACAR|nr:unnamed protein product [Medioppia subpectinata]CAG2106357.1 unnamed protein product [Medioppia subpectinata]
MTLSLWTDGYNGSHASIHFYPNITAIGCGVGRKGMLRDNTCFTYHPNSDTMFAGIQNGRVVQTGEQPWAVFITHKKKTYLLCGTNCTATDIRVYPGLTNQKTANHTYYTGGQYFITPEYESNQWQPFDLGLIRLNTAIPLDGTSGVTGINAICLPEEWAANQNEEYVQLVGFGKDNGTRSGTLRSGYAKMMTAHRDQIQNTALSMQRIPFPSGSGICLGDSGSPVVQYVNGVAVVIGITVSATMDTNNSCQKLTEEAGMTAIRVSHHIQWIINTIYNNTN